MTETAMDGLMTPISRNLMSLGMGGAADALGVEVSSRSFLS